MKVARHEMPGSASRESRPGRARYDRLASCSRAVERVGALLNQTVPYGTDTNAGSPGISCLATIIGSLRDTTRIHTAVGLGKKDGGVCLER
jgi:hypothetical protein